MEYIKPEASVIVFDDDVITKSNAQDAEDDKFGEN